MQTILKYSPYVVLLIAIVSLILQYKTFQAANGDCGCKGNQLDTGTGPIVN